MVNNINFTITISLNAEDVCLAGQVSVCISVSTV